MTFFCHPSIGLFLQSKDSPAGLLTIHYSAKQLGIAFPQITRDLDLSAAKSIYNAWMETSIIDNYGMVWVLPRRLSEILRTSKANARYIADKIPDKYKSKGAAGTYFYYPELDKELNIIIMSAGSISREKYAGFSELIGREIRDCAKAKLLRAETYDAMSKAKKKLKQQRIRFWSIKHDELTGKPLSHTSQFSHIRSCAIYPQFTTCVWNGLVVNQPIHRIITDAYVNDEDELYELCKSYDWRTDWYEDYIAQFN